MYVYMLDLFDTKDKQRFVIRYKNTDCYFLPENSVDPHNLPDEISGHVIYAEPGEYNPESWLKYITIEKDDISHIGKNNKKYISE